MAASTARRGIWIGLTAVFVLLIGFGLWFALSARAAVNEMTVARDSLVAAREAVTKGQPDQARTFITAASNSASAAADRVNGPLWNIAAGVPVLGDTPRTAQAVATSLDQALIALQPLIGQLNILDPSSVTSDGQIDVATIQEALPAMKQAEPGLNEAVATVESAPANGAVLPQVRSAAEQFTEELTGLQSTVSTVVRVGDIAAPMLGADGPQRYFVGVLNPNEARGTGGFLGTYAILTADDGKLSVDQVGSNTDLPNLDALPDNLSKGFEDRYRDDPILRGNMNLSPHMLNGKEWSSFQFEEQDRPAAAVGVTLPPREKVQVEIVFTKPASDGPGMVVMQPLADEPTVEVVDVECSEG